MALKYQKNWSKLIQKKLELFIGFLAWIFSLDFGLDNKCWILVAKFHFFFLNLHHQSERNEHSF